MDLFNYFLLFVFGLLVGSFLNVVVYREVSEIENELEEVNDLSNKGIMGFFPSWVVGRSACPKCSNLLSWYENIPLLSYLLLGGRCKNCKQPISIQYPLIELFTAIEFVWIYWLLSRFSFFQQMEGLYSVFVLGFWLFIFSLSVVLSIIDIRTQILPDSLVLAGTVVAVLRLFVTGRWEFLLVGLGLFLFFLFLYVATQGKGIGFGDVKLAFFIGVVLGWWQWAVIAMFIAFLTGAVVGVILIFTGSKTMKSALPFGPFMLGGMLITKVLGDYLWYLYVGMLGY